MIKIENCKVVHGDDVYNIYLKEENSKMISIEKEEFEERKAKRVKK